MAKNDLISFSVKNIEEVTKQLNQVKQSSATVLKRTVSDFASRAPAWVSAGVTEVYNIKKKAVKDALVKVDRHAGKANIGGQEVDNAELIYSSSKRPNYAEFKHSPASAPKKRQSQRVTIPSDRVKWSTSGKYTAVRPPAPYRVKVEEKKGFSQQLEEGAFVAKVWKQPKAGVFSRKARNEKYKPDKVVPMQGHSVPYMIGDDKDVREKVEDKVADGMAKRFQHHLDQALKKQL